MVSSHCVFQLDNGCLPLCVSGMSDIPTAFTVPPPRKGNFTPDMKEKMNDMQCRLHQLRVELQGLRRMEQLNQEAMKDAFHDTMGKLKV